MKKSSILSALLLFGAATASAAAPEVTAPDPTLNAEDVISIYSDKYQNAEGFTVNPNWGQPTVTSEMEIDGNHFISMAGLTYQGHEFANTDVTSMEFLHVDIFPTTATKVDLVPIWKNVEADGNFTEIVYTISNLKLNEWNSVDIDLANFADEGRNGTNVVWQFKWVSSDVADFYVDNIYFFALSGEDTEAPVWVKAEAAKVNGTTATILVNATDNLPSDLSYTVFNGADQIGSVTAAPGRDAVINLTGLTVSTEYNLTVKVADKAGNEAAEAKTVNFTTLDADILPVWYGSVEGTNDKGAFTIDYNITYNADHTITLYAEMEGPADLDFNHKVSFVRGIVEEWKEMTADGDGWTYTTTNTIEADKEVEFFFWLEYAGGVFGGDYHQVYVAGSENEKPASLRIAAEAQNVTTTGAEIAYTLKGDTEGAKVFYKAADAADWTEAAASPIALTGLTPNTECTYALKAETATVTSKEITVSFKTLREGAVDLVYADYLKAEFHNAYLVGEEASAARTFYFSLPFSVTLTADGSARYEINLSECADIVGLNPQIWWNGFHNLTKGENGIYYYDFGAQTEGGDVAISHYLAYAGGVIDRNFSADYNKWGQEKELPALGEAANLTLAASKQYVKINEPVYLTAVATDAAGYYLSAANVEYTADAAVTIENGVAKVAGTLGTFTITATAGSLTATADITVMANETAENLASQKTLKPLTAGDPEDTSAITDGNLSSTYAFGAGDNHSIYLDLGAAYYIDAIHVIWEGAYAQTYTITLTNNDPAAAVATYAVAEDETVLSHDATHEWEDLAGAGNSVQVVHLNPASTSQHQYVVLNTTKAGTDWGIKLRQISVYGSATAPDVTTGIESVMTEEDANAPVEYYNLNGIRVQNPENGLYIRRQGTKVQKVVL